MLLEIYDLEMSLCEIFDDAYNCKFTPGTNFTVFINFTTCMRNYFYYFKSQTIQANINSSEENVLFKFELLLP